MYKKSHFSTANYWKLQLFITFVQKGRRPICAKKSQWFSHARQGQGQFLWRWQKFWGDVPNLCVLQSFSNTSCLLFPSFAGMFAAANLSNFRTNVQQQQQQNWVQQLTAGDEEPVKMVSKAENYRLASCHIIKSWFWSRNNFICHVTRDAHDLIRFPWLFWPFLHKE